MPPLLVLILISSEYHGEIRGLERASSNDTLRDASVYLRLIATIDLDVNEKNQRMTVDSKTTSDKSAHCIHLLPAAKFGQS